MKTKKNYKLLKLATKAELCLSRNNAQKIIKKAEKLNKTNHHLPINNI